MAMKYLFKDTFAVIGKAGQGAADNNTRWIHSLWDGAGNHFPEIEHLARKDENNGVLWWGLMDGVGDPLKYMVGCEVNVDAKPPAGWEKRTLPAQTYIVASCTPNTTGEVFEQVKTDQNIKIIGEGYEHYPNPSDNSIVEVYCPVAEGILYCSSCSIPMTKPEDFGTELGGDSCCNHCCHCYNDGILRESVTMEALTADIRKLVNIEAAHPYLLSEPLLEYIKIWLPLNEAAKMIDIPPLLSVLIDGQDCDFTGTQWEKEWLADGKVCHCIACVAARKCISDIKLMGGATNGKNHASF